MNDTPPEPSFDHDDRRNFIHTVLSLVIGAFLGLFPLLVGLVSFLNPLRSKRKLPTVAAQSSGDAPEGYTRLCALAALGVGDPPLMFQVVGDKQDGWNFAADQDIGTVFAQRIAEDDVRVFNATCPHAGCLVGCDGEAFLCPCHNSSFNIDGTKRVSGSGRENPSPRDMDKLDVETSLLSQGEVWVKYENYYTGRHERKPKG